MRPEGTYLITGGLGRARPSERLDGSRSAGRARLVLVEPAEASSCARSGTSSLPGDVARKEVAAILDLERLGATVVVANVDVADPEGMSALFERLRETLPPIGGSSTRRGLVTNEATHDLDLKTLASVLRPKVAGTRILDELSRDLPLDFFVLFSSVASILGAKEAALRRGQRVPRRLRARARRPRDGPS